MLVMQGKVTFFFSNSSSFAHTFLRALVVITDILDFLSDLLMM